MFSESDYELGDVLCIFTDEYGNVTRIYESDILIDDCDIPLSEPRNIRKIKLKLKYAGKNGQRSQE